ncbi:hypothetical protein ABZ491_12300 [Micromonospora rifamycinica]|uniref:hypothetical protein n=1 Tax=Micromonospora rifamycinica TaxID=291594 RepID=UPI0033FBA365
MQQQLVHLGRLLAVAPPGGEAFGEPEEGHRLAGGQVLLAHEPAVPAPDGRHPAGDGDPEHHARHRAAQQPEQHLERGADPRLPTDLRLLHGTPTTPVAQPTDQVGPPGAGAVHAHVEGLLHQPVGQRIVPEPQPGRPERLQGQLPVQLPQQGRDVGEVGAGGQVQHGVRHLATRAPPDEPTQQETRVAAGGRPDQPEHRQPAVLPARPAQQPGEQGEQLRAADRGVVRGGRPGQRRGHRFAHTGTSAVVGETRGLPLSTMSATDRARCGAAGDPDRTGQRSAASNVGR